ncbi:MAG: HypC/HybG/HupF family hydrogenase formation chaperone [Pirellulales bacterium]|nr:HypC/HybG/HupF family hydrogenase formation chaperone [Pirellulales bacterium]
MCLGIPGKVIEKYGDDALPMSKVDFGGVQKEVCLAYTPEVEIGDYVIVHVGFAISVIDEAEAQEIFSYLQEIEEQEMEGMTNDEERMTKE